MQPCTDDRNEGEGSKPSLEEIEGIKLSLTAHNTGTIGHGATSDTGLSAMASVLWLLGYSLLSQFYIFFPGSEGEKSPSLLRGSKLLIEIYI